MNCPSCQQGNTRVIDSRHTQDGRAIRRRRECLSCNYRFTTYEYVEIQPILVVKSDRRREPFDREKILRSLAVACSKRPVAMDQLNGCVEDVINDINEMGQPEVHAKDIGEIVMKHLRGLDEIAYVRFASVYRKFQDVREFRAELEEFDPSADAADS